MSVILKNRYRILHNLKSGGFGETFLAEDIDMPSARRCVIKKLIPITHDPQTYQLVKERFGREAAILEKLGEGCSQIPTLYAYFEENGHFYLVQEWIEGVSLSEKVQQEGVLNEDLIREILTDILLVLDYIHSQHIVHRDIKPDNIIIRATNKKPVLIDFGAVKETMGTILTTSGRSTSSIVIGTPGFMSSEQAVGRPVYASDLYSLALTAIYLLTAKYPQKFDSSPATGELLWRQYAPHVSSTLAVILDKAIQSHPRDRFTTAKEMLAAINPQVSNLLTGVASNFITSPNSAPFTDFLTAVASSGVNKKKSPANVTAFGGLKDWQKASIVGGIVGTFIIGAIAVNSIFSRPSPIQTTASPTTQPKPVASNTPTAQPTQPSEPVNPPSNEREQPAQPNEPKIDNTPVIRQPSDTSDRIPERVTVPPTRSENNPENSIDAIDEDEARDFLGDLYNLLSEKDFEEAKLAYSPRLVASFDPNFFTQFERISIENLQTIAKSNNSIEFIGENTYYYLDGSRQKEKRSYTIQVLNGELKITDSQFIKVTKPR
jgi:serine/threonine protein kinase, bacterial